MISTPHALILIPAFNEELSIQNLLENALHYFPVLVVDDGSTDQTADLARAVGARVLSQHPNQGKGAALRAGFNSAIESGYEAVITLDGDGQHDPSEIPTFIDCFIKSHADLIIGRRDFTKMPIVRRVANTIGRLSFSWALGQTIYDNQSGYRMVSRRLLNALVSSEESGFEFEVEMIVTCILSKFILEWVPIRTIYADEHSHIVPHRHVLGFYRMVLHTRKQMRS